MDGGRVKNYGAEEVARGGELGGGRFTKSARAGEVVVRVWERRVSCWSESRCDDNRTGRPVVER